MNLVLFCENRFQELTLETQSNAYDCAKDAELKAIHQILNSYRSILKLIMIPKCLIDFAAVNLGYLDEPKAALIEKHKAMQKAKEQEMSEAQ